MPEQREAQPGPQPVEAQVTEPENWYPNDPEGPFVATSVATAGPSRELGSERHELAGNMSEKYPQPDQPELKGNSEAMVVAAREHVNHYLDTLGLKPEQTAIMRPQKDYSDPLQPIDVDEVFHPGESGHDATWLARYSDLIYTRDPEKVLACRPADCPVLVGQGVDGNGQNLLFVAHLGWHDLEARYFEQTFEFLQSQGVSNDSLRLYMSPRGFPESFHYHNPQNPFVGGPLHVTHPHADEFFVNLRTEPDGEYHWDVDTGGFIVSRLREAGIKDEQLFVEATDTASLESGHSSNTRSKNAEDTETRDIVVATMKPSAGSVSYPSAK